MRGLYIFGFAYKSLVYSKRKTASIIVSHGLSIGLILFASMTIYSHIVSVITMKMHTYGAHSAILWNITDNGIDVISGQTGIETIGVIKVRGWVQNESETLIEPFFCASFDENARKLANMILLEGEEPKKTDEIAVSRTFLFAMNLKVGLGDEVNLVTYDNFGNREASAYRISGIYDDFLVDEDGQSNAIPKLVVVDPGLKPHTNIALVKTRHGINTEDLLYYINKSGSLWESNTINDTVYTRTSGIRILSSQINDSMFQILLSVIIIMTLIGTVNVTRIYARSQRKQIALLKLVGATRRQLRILFLAQEFLILLFALFLGAPLGFLMASSMPDIVYMRYSYTPITFSYSLHTVAVSITATAAITILITYIPVLKIIKSNGLMLMRNGTMRGKSTSLHFLRSVPAALGLRSAFSHGNIRATLCFFTSSVMVLCFGVFMIRYTQLKARPYIASDYKISQTSVSNTNFAPSYLNFGLSEYEYQSIANRTHRGHICYKFFFRKKLHKESESNSFAASSAYSLDNSFP